MALINAQHIAPAAGFFEPQRQYDWSIEIPLDPQGDQIIIMQSLESSNLPTESNEEIELHFANEVRYVAGKAIYETIPLILKDFVDQQTKNAMIRWRRRVYNPETGSVGLASDYKKNASLVLVGPNGETTRVWRLIGIWPQMVNYGPLDMTASEKVLIEATLRYDRAVPAEGLNTGLGGINLGVTTI